MAAKIQNDSKINLVNLYAPKQDCMYGLPDFLYKAEFTPKKTGTFIYINKTTNVLSYKNVGAVTTGEVSPADLSEISFRINDIISQRQMLHYAPPEDQYKNDLLALRNIERINIKIAIHNERWEKTYLFAFLNFFGLGDWNAVEIINVNALRVTFRNAYGSREAYRPPEKVHFVHNN